MNAPQVQFLSKCVIVPYGTTVMRCAQPSEYLRSRGWTTSYGCIYRTLPRASKAIVFHRVALDNHTRTYFDYARSRGLVLVYDIDDYLFGGRPPYKSAARYREAMELCDFILVSTEFLAREARKFHGDVRVVRNGLSESFVERVGELAAPHGNLDRAVTVAYLSGSRYHDRDFQVVESALLQLLDAVANVRLLIAGKLNFSESFRRFGERFEYREFMPYHAFQRVFSEIDVNLAPLRVTDPFAQGRSELKYIEAGAWAIPTVASPTETYQSAIRSGVNGLLASDGEWFPMMKRMVEDASFRKRLGEEARHDVERAYFPKHKSYEWDTLLSSIIEEYKPRCAIRRTRWSTQLHFVRCCARLVQRYQYRARGALQARLGISAFRRVHRSHD